MWHRFSPTLRQAVQAALKYAEHADRPAYLSSVSLLQGLWTVGDGAAHAVLRRLGFAADKATEWGREEPHPGLTLPARAAVERAYDEALALGDRYVGTEHLLLGILRTPDCSATQALMAQGITIAQVGETLLQVQPQRLRAPAGVSDPLATRRRLRAWRENALYAALPALQVGYMLAQSRDDPLIALFGVSRTGGRLHPHSLYRRLHERGMYRSRGGGGWVAARYEDAVRALREPGLSARRFDLDGANQLPPLIEREFNTLCGGLSRQMLFLDAPEQTRLRSRLSRRFTPRVIDGMREQIARTAEQLLDAVEARGRRMDVIADYAFPLPAAVIAGLLGVCADDLGRFKEWSDDFVRFIGGEGSFAEDLRAYRSLRDLTVYFQRAIEEVRAEPNNTLLSLLVHSEDDEGRLTDDEVLANCLLLLAAGHETTTHLIANGLLLLLRHPDQRERLRQEPALLSGAVEEILRYESVVQWTSRVATRDIDWGEGVRIAAGQMVYIGLGAANRDPGRFPDPDRFDIGRENAGKHLAFGFGAHFCLGAALARMEAEIALEALLRRWPRLRPGWLPGAPPRRRQDFTFRALKALPVRQ